MAWTAPATFTDGSILTGAQLNAMSANFNETAPAKATTAGGYIVTTGANTIVQRDPGSNTINTTQSTTSTTYVGLGGPDVTGVVSGTRVICWFTAQLNNSVSNVESIMSISVTGASAVAADDNVSVATQSPTALSDITVSRCIRFGITAGTNNFVPQYRVGAASTGNFRRRSVVVLPA